MNIINKVLTKFGWQVQRYKATRGGYKTVKKLHHTQTPESRKAASLRAKARWEKIAAELAAKGAAVKSPA